jgi:hypothetical protein
MSDFTPEEEYLIGHKLNANSKAIKAYKAKVLAERAAVKVAKKSAFVPVDRGGNVIADRDKPKKKKRKKFFSPE